MMFDFIFDLIHIAPLSLAAVLTIGLPLSEMKLLSFTIATDLCCLLLHHQKPRLRTAILISLLAGAGSLCVLNRSFLTANLWALRILAVCIACLIIEKISQQYRPLRSVSVVLVLTYLLVSMLNKTHVNKLAALMIFFYVITVLAEAIQLNWKKQGDTRLSRHIVFISPFLLAAILIIGIIKLPERPYDWAFFRKGVQEIRIMLDSIGKNGKEKTDSFSVGFSDDAIINGGLSIASYKALDIFSNVYGEPALYLGGKSFDRFEDLKWMKSDESSIDYRTYDLIESTAAFLSCGKEGAVDRFRSSFMDIRCTGTVSDHVFAPLKSTPPAEKVQTIQSGGDFLFAEGIEETYKVRFFRYDRDAEDFRDLLSDRKEMTEKEFNEALDMLNPEEPSEYTYEGYCEYIRRIKEIYCPGDETSKRTRDLLLEITKDADSNYEKLLCIRNYLSSMEYDLKPGKLPKDVSSAAEYLDYFLFESRRGYCVHYATAFVLLARAEGIPARYVQGYRFPLTAGSTQVRSDNAHAWAEVYLEGFGWLEFEATPKTGNNASQTTSEIAGKEDVDHNSEDTDNSEIRHGKLLIPVMAVSLSLLVLLLIDRGIRRNRFEKTDDREKIKILFRRNLKLLQRMNLAMEKGETLSEYAQRIKEKIPVDITETIAIYEETIYGDRAIGDSEVNLFRQANILLRRKLLDHVFSRLKIRQG